MTAIKSSNIICGSICTIICCFIDPYINIKVYIIPIKRMSLIAAITNLYPVFLWEALLPAVTIGFCRSTKTYSYILQYLDDLKLIYKIRLDNFNSFIIIQIVLRECFPQMMDS